MSNRLSSVGALNYQGTNAQMPPNTFIFYTAPTSQNYQNFSVGDFWVHVKSRTTNDSDLYVLMGVAANVADWVLLSNSAGTLLSLTGDTGGAVDPDISGNININGAHGINTAGNPGTHTIDVAINNAITLGDLSSIVGSPAITLTTGDATISSGNINMTVSNSAGTSGVINAGANRFISNYPGTPAFNVFVGEGSGNFTQNPAVSAHNSGFGAITLSSLTTGRGNTAIGQGSGNAITSGDSNNLCGYTTGGLITTGSNNSALGNSALNNLTTGSNNIAIGQLAGGNYTTSESSNILLNNTGTIGESNICRIGSGTGSGSQQLNKTFISGIYGVTPDVPTPLAVVVDSNGQLGTAPSTKSAFNVYLNSNVTNVTGDGTFYQLAFDTKLFDLNNDYSTGTNLFTAPVTGYYYLTATALFENITVGMDSGTLILTVTGTSAGTYSGGTVNPYAAGAASIVALPNGYTFFVNALVPMTAGDTAKITINIGTSTKTVTYIGVTGGFRSYFNGYLVTT